jgi:transposase
MPGVPLSDDLKDRIVKWYYEDQETMKEIAVQARCSIGTISNVLRLYREYGEFKDPFRQRTGRPSKLSEADLKFLDAIVVANPSLYLDEIQQKLKDVREVEVSIATLARALASLELTRKQITKAASERDPLSVLNLLCLAVGMCT